MLSMVSTMIHSKRIQMLVFLGIGLPILFQLRSPAYSQEPHPELPLVVAGKMPIYPIIARAARVHGVVKIRVTTDGMKVSSLQAESGPAMLVQAAKEDILTWQFAKHKPTTFVTTFEYLFEGSDKCIYSNGMSVLNLPLKVRISAKGLMTCDPEAEKKSHP